MEHVNGTIMDPKPILDKQAGFVVYNPEEDTLGVHIPYVGLVLTEASFKQFMGGRFITVHGDWVVHHDETWVTIGEF